MQGTLKGFARELTMRRYLLAGAAAALLALPALAFGGTVTTVTLTNSNTFSPKTVTKTVGTGGIHWQWGAGGSTFAAHNVRQDSKLFYSGSLTSSDPGGYDIVPSAGAFHYYCELHGSPSGGMNGTIKVKPLLFNKTANSFGVEWSTGSNQTGNAFDVRYRVDSGTWKIWKSGTTTRQATFGANDRPIHVGPNHTYDIQARSKSQANPSKLSGWSPLARRGVLSPQN
jgi:plastocyanin